MVAKVHSTTKQVVQIASLLAKHLKPSQQAGLFVYEGDWTDKSVALTVGGGLNEGHVSRTRLELYGPLVKPASLSDDVRFADMQKLIEKLTADLSDLNGRHDKLCQTLALNRVADVKHLARPAK